MRERSAAESPAGSSGSSRESPIAELLSGLAGRSDREQLDLFSRVGRHGRRKLLRDGRRTFPLPKEAASLEAEVKVALTTIGKERGERSFWKLRDIAGRIAGKGSLGRPRYVALVKGHGDPDGNYLIDIKSAWPSAVLGAVDTPQPQFADAAERVVFTQRLMQARSPAFLQPILLANTSYILRELQPSEDRLEIDALVGRPKRLSLAHRDAGRGRRLGSAARCGPQRRGGDRGAHRLRR